MYGKMMIILAAAATLCACGGNRQSKAESQIANTEQVTDLHNAENSLDLAGLYTGTLPAADCPGIEVKLLLCKDGYYDLKQNYIDRDASFSEAGKYIIAGNLLTLSSDTEISYYKIEENRLRKLTTDKQEITGELAKAYVLNKTIKNE